MNALPFVVSGSVLALCLFALVVFTVRDRRARRRASDMLYGVASELGLGAGEVRLALGNLTGPPDAQWSGLRQGRETILALIPQRSHKNAPSTPARAVVAVAVAPGPAALFFRGYAAPFFATPIGGPWQQRAAATSSGDATFDQHVAMSVGNSWSNLTGMQFVPRFDPGERCKAALRSMPPEVFVQFDGLQLTVSRQAWLTGAREWKEFLELVDRLSVLGELRLPNESAISAPYQAAGGWPTRIFVLAVILSIGAVGAFQAYTLSRPPSPPPALPATAPETMAVIPAPSPSSVVAPDPAPIALMSARSTVNFEDVTIAPRTALSTTLLTRILRSHGRAFARCPADGSGPVRLSFELNESGDVGEVGITHTDASGAAATSAVDDCIRGVARGLSFPEPRTPAVVTLTLR